MTIHLVSPALAQKWCDEQRSTGSLGFVPTMGALHEGHLSLVSRSIEENDYTCASIFVNPLQFDNTSDLDAYPKTFESDFEQLESLGCDMVFTGTLAQFFPEVTDIKHIDRKDPGPAGKGLEAEHRPGHLEGVYLIVERLFQTVGDCRAYFGEKDFQQTLVVRTLANRLKDQGCDIDIVTCPTIREESGLAMSSRNQRLSERNVKPRR